MQSESGQRPGMQRRAVVSSTLGSALEWFDFATYGALSATLLPTLFFSGQGDTGALLQSFATFGVGFAARPLGAIAFGYLGDRFGRRPILLATFMTMGISSMVIGLLPTGRGVQIAAVLVAMRFLQGFALGGESTGSQLMTMEHAAVGRRGIFGALMNAGSPLSQVIANLALVLLVSILSEEQWVSWGWRVLFLASILLVATGVYIRLKLDETPAFVSHRENPQQAARDQRAVKQNGLRVLVTQPRTIVRLVLVWAAPSVTFYLIATYGLNYLTQHGVTTGVSFTILLVGNGVSLLFGLFGGWLSDRIGRRPILLIGNLGMIAGSLAFFPVAGAGLVVPSMLAVALTLSAVQFSFGAQAALFAEQFPTPTRFSGSALSLNLATLIFAAPAPFAAAALTDVGGTATVVWGTFGIQLISVLALLTVKNDRRHIDLATFTELDHSGQAAPGR